MRTPLALAVSSLLLLAPLAGCASTRIALAETFGYEKREQLVDRVAEARDAQSEAQETFNSALEEFLAVTGASGGELEARYERLQSAYDRSSSRADRVRSRIRAVERVADALFGEWERELDDYESERLRAASADQLDDTRSAYGDLLRKMRAAEARMDPVLVAFGDQVLFLKHNLNARAVASLSETVGELETEIADLVAEMQASIDEANAFIDALGASG